jgi:NAD(P)H-nitrite reductase large subunit
MKQYVIIGASAAGISAAEAIRRYDREARILLISDEPEKPYLRVMLSFVLAGTIAGDKLPIRPEKFYDSMGITPVFGRKVVGVDPSKNQVILDDRTKIDYHALLLATGARPWPLEIPGNDRDGVFYFRSAQDLHGILNRLKDTRQAVVIGGGLVGIKVADALCDRGVDVTMMVRSKNILSQTADPCTAAIVLNKIKSRGVSFVTGVNPVAFQGEGVGVDTVVTDKGDEIPCQLAVIGKGVRPNTGLAEDASLGVENGILTTPCLATSIPNIFAAGDAAKTLDIVSGVQELHSIWPAAVEEGRIAGCNMCGMNLPFAGTIHCNAFHIDDTHVITGGTFNPGQDDGYMVHESHDHGKNIHHRIVTRDDRMVGMSFVNDTRSAGIALAMIRRQQKISSLPAGISHLGLNVGGMYLQRRDHEIGHY